MHAHLKAENEFRKYIDSYINDIDANLETPVTDIDQYMRLYDQQVFYNKEQVPVLFMKVRVDASNMIKVDVRPIGDPVAKNPLQINKFMKDGDYYSLTQPQPLPQ
jgi:hypothetical protein